MRTGAIRVAEISLNAVRDNTRYLRGVTGGGNLIAVVKANGYGHGMSIVAGAALEGGATMLAVADLEEALTLRAEGFTAPILCWLYGDSVDMVAALQHRIEVGVSHMKQLDKVAAAATQLGVRGVVQLKLDTGLSRNGASSGEWQELFAAAAALESDGVITVKGLFSHLANAGATEDMKQKERFDEAIALANAAGLDPELIHLAASAATLSSPHLHYNCVRVGVAIMGLSPFAGRTSADLGLTPAMTLKAEILALRDVTAGTGVSYGYNHRCESDTRLALVPIGYADGMPRALNGAGATVTVRGVHCPIVGRIGMDQCIVDLGPLGNEAADVTTGESVTLFGDPERGDPSVDVWADLMHTINYEIVADIGARVLRVGVDEDGGGAERIDGGAAGSGGAEARATGQDL